MTHNPSQQTIKDITLIEQKMLRDDALTALINGVLPSEIQRYNGLSMTPRQQAITQHVEETRGCSLKALLDEIHSRDDNDNKISSLKRR